MKTTQTTLLNGKVQIVQPETGYRTGIDTVFLATSLDVALFKKNEAVKVLDLGCGVGTAGICALQHFSPLSDEETPQLNFKFYGLEIQEELVALAHENIHLNKREGQFTVLKGDLRNLPEGIEKNSFSAVIMNPPFYPMDQNNLSPHPIKKAANAEVFGGLEDWIGTSYKCLKQKGYLSMIYPADRLHVLMAALIAAKFGEITVYPLWSKAGVSSKRVIIRARKGGKGGDPMSSPLKLQTGLIVHQENGDYTPEAQAILMGKKGLLDV
ncbi:MAG: tRNA1(Val) (adenine(37)-N6)-methyltransferase [Alphaproteobacteria bacterium]